MEDGSYIRLKNITLSYGWNHPFKSAGLERLQFSFTATNLLAKHDERYMPPQVAGAMHETKTLRP